MSKKITFINNPSEIAAGTRGSSLGFGALKVAAFNLFTDLFRRPIVDVQDANHYLLRDTAFPFAKRIDGLVEVFGHLNDGISKVIQSGNFPLIIAGDHASAAGTLASLRGNYPNKRLGVIWIDAHADIHSPYTTPSGNVHGMPLAIALHEDNLESGKNELDPLTTQHWNRLKDSFGANPILPSDLVYIAVRDTEDQEEAAISKLKLKWVTVDDVSHKTPAGIVEETLAYLEECDLIYVSFDVDSMDPHLTSHGTGTPVDNGLSQSQAEALLIGFAKSPKLICLEVVEVNPCLDEQINRMAEVTVQILVNVVRVIEEN